MDISKIRLLACGYFLEGYPRYDTLWQALSRLGLAQLLDLRDKRILDSKELDILRNDSKRNIFQRISGAIRSIYRLSRYAVTITREARREKTHIIFIFPANFFLAISLKMLKVFHGARIYFDLYTSAYSAAKTYSPGKLSIVKAYLLEFLSASFADRLICLTPEYADYYRNLYKIKASRFSVVRDGVQDIWFEEPVHVGEEAHRPGRVLYWGNFLIHHGLDMILDIAGILKNENIEFIFCGKGNGEAWAREEARKRNLINVVFKGFIPTIEELIHIVDSADIALGHLKEIHDIRLSAANKQMQGMARGKPVITVWTKQQEDLYRTRDNPLPPLVQIKPDKEALLAAIKNLMSNPDKAEQIGSIARETVERYHSVAAIMSALKQAIEIGG